jgi:ribonucleotide reductase alpha subunit
MAAGGRFYSRVTRERVKTIGARELFRAISEARICAAILGPQFDCENSTLAHLPNAGRINASTPCGLVGETLVDTSEGRIRMDQLAKRLERQVLYAFS